MNLAFDVTGMNGSPHVLSRRVAQDFDFARFGIDLDVDAVRGERPAAALRIDRRAANNRVPRLLNLFGDLLEREFLPGRPIKKLSRK